MIHTVLSHGTPERTDAQLQFLHALCPDVLHIAAYGGTVEGYWAIKWHPKIFVNEPTFHAPGGNMECAGYLERVHYEAACYGRHEPVYFTEYDHAVLTPKYAKIVVGKLRGTDFVGKITGATRKSEWMHSQRWYKDTALLDFLKGISAQFPEGDYLRGILGDGYAMTWEALDTFCSINHYPAFYEVYIPTVLHHLGFSLGDFGAAYKYVSCEPRRNTEFVLAALAEGVPFVHPYKARAPVVYAEVLRASAESQV